MSLLPRRALNAWAFFFSLISLRELSVSASLRWKAALKSRAPGLRRLAAEHGYPYRTGVSRYTVLLENLFEKRYLSPPGRRHYRALRRVAGQESRARFRAAPGASACTADAGRPAHGRAAQARTRSRVGISARAGARSHAGVPAPQREARSKSAGLRRVGWR